MFEFVGEALRAQGSELALARGSERQTYGALLPRVDGWRTGVAELPPGSVVSIEGDYGPESIALFLALTWTGHVAVPLSPDSSAHHDSCLEIASVEYRVKLDGDVDGNHQVERTTRRADHPLYAALRADTHPGLVLFSSGSTGQPKAAVHDLARLLAKVSVPRRKFRTLLFLLLDHIGGINTLFYTLSNGGAAVLPRDRSPSAWSETIAPPLVGRLPPPPTFPNLLLLSGDAAKHDVSSLKLITYGTEPMPASTLA